MTVKKVLTYLLLTIVTLLLTLFITYWIAPDWEEDTAVDILYPTVTIEEEYIDTVSLEIPKVYELMYIACSLTETFKQDENLISKRTPKYYTDVQNHFGSYDQHPLVTLLEDKLKNNAYSQVQPAIRLFALNYDLEQDNSLKENEIFHVNPISDKYRAKIEEAIPDYRQWNHQKNGYRSSMSTFNEYMTWAIFSLYALENYQPEQIEKILSVQEAFMIERRKFIHFKTFNRELICLYEDQRAKTGKKELETLYSPLLKWMEKKR